MTDNLEKLQAVLEFLGPELSKQFSGRINELRDQVKKEKNLNDDELNMLLGER